MLGIRDAESKEMVSLSMDLQEPGLKRGNMVNGSRDHLSKKDKSP